MKIVKGVTKSRGPTGARSRLYFRRYTTIASMLDVLCKRQLTLLSPSGWDDENDRECMASYKEAVEAKTLLALCLTEALETYHHWRNFANGQDGACIYFYKDVLRDELQSRNDVRFEKVEYLSSNDAKLGVNFHDLPFRKFSAYAAEGEWRIVHKHHKDYPTKSISVSRKAFFKVALNPWMPPTLFTTIQGIVHKIEGFEDLKVDASKIRKNEQWLTDVLKR